MIEPIVKMTGIKKRFPGVQALDGVDLTIYPGEIHALLGENGAGKSVLLKILLGAIQKDAGEIVFDGKPVAINDPLAACDLGIGAVYQDLKLAMSLSVAENIGIGRLPNRFGIVDKRAMRENARRILDELNLDIDVNEKLSDLIVAKKQMVSIAKALSTNVRVLVLDEPTAMLTNEETQTLFKAVRALKEKGVAVIYVSHRLEEIFEICDRVTILRDGKKIGDYDVKGMTSHEMVVKMAGREVKDVYKNDGDKRADTDAKEVLVCEHLTSGHAFKDVSFSVRQGEIVGFFGLVGAGRTEVMRAIFGADKYESGRIVVNGRELSGHSVSTAISRGIGLVPEDRPKQGVALNLSIKSNVNMTNYGAVSRLGVVSREKESAVAKKYIDLLKVKTPGSEQLVRNLSGGNQQKVAIAKWLNKNPRLLIFDEPTIGVDVSTKFEIYDLLKDLAASGVAIVFISSYMPELIGVCDRIIVMSNGRITANVMKEDFDENRILEYAFVSEDAIDAQSGGESA